MAVNFPTPGFVGETFSVGTDIWAWDGTEWLLNNGYWGGDMKMKNIAGTRFVTMAFESAPGLGGSSMVFGMYGGGGYFVGNGHNTDGLGHGSAASLVADDGGGGNISSLTAYSAGKLAWTGNMVGVNATLPAWAAASNAFHLGAYASISTIAGGGNILVSENAYWNGTNWKYINTAEAANYYQQDGTHVWRSAASGAAGSNLTWTEVGYFTKRTTTPTPTANVGAFTTVSCEVNYQRLGDSVFFDVTITDTTNGTAAGWIIVPMPFTAVKECVAAGRQAAIGGNMVQGVMLAGTSNILVFKYDNTYPGATGERITLSGRMFV